MEKECPICGVFFESHHHSQVYCDECRKNPAKAKKELEIHLKESISRCGNGRLPEKIVNTCHQCKKIFITYGRRKDFCSSKCNHNFNIEHTFCDTCGKPMKETKDQKNMNGQLWYCSEECREIHDWEIARKQGKVRICQECGKEYIKKGTKFCSKDCYYSFIKKHPNAFTKKESQKQTKQCIVCHNTFECLVNELGLPFCSDVCRKKYQKSEKARIKKEKEIAQKQKQEKEFQNYISKNGLCSICLTSYVDCERMQSGFRLSPKGSVFKGALVVKCPKFTHRHQ